MKANQSPPLAPKFSKLPAAGERCKLTGASRSWLLDADQRAGERAFLFKVTKAGKRGVTFINNAKLLAFMDYEENAYHNKRSRAKHR